MPVLSPYAQPPVGGAPTRPSVRYGQIILGARPTDLWPIDDPNGSTTFRNLVQPSRTLGAFSNMATARYASLLARDPAGRSAGPGRCKMGVNWTATPKGTFELLMMPHSFIANVAVGAWDTNGVMIFVTAGAVVRCYLNGTNASAPANSVIDREIAHWAITWDGAIQRLYKDGVILASQAVGSPSSPACPFEVGSYNNSSGGQWLSQFQWVAIYDRALTPGEVLLHSRAAVRR